MITNPEYSENKEFLSSKYDLVVDAIRHGEADYTEKEKNLAKYEGELMEEEKEKIASVAREIVEGIDKEQEVVLVVTSPRLRAIETAQEIFKTLKEEGINPFHRIEIRGQLEDAALTPGFLKQYKEVMPEKGWMNFWEIVENLPEGTEKPEEVEKRTNDFLAALAKVTRNYHLPEGKKLHLISVIHEETFRELLKKTFSGELIGGNILGNAERVRLGFNKTNNKNQVNIDIKYRDFPIRTVNFNIEQGQTE